MTAAPTRERLMVTRDTRPVLPHHIKLRLDNGRGRWVILGPERVFEPDETAVAVLKLCNGQRSAHEIAAALARDFAAPIQEILADIMSMLQDLADKGVVTASACRPPTGPSAEMRIFS